MKLSKTQERALEKLTDKWQSSYGLQESRNTLNALVRLELAGVRYLQGACFMPRNCIEYRKRGNLNLN